MAGFFDTIVAPITGVENAAVAIVRLSGPDSWSIASNVFCNWPDPVEPRFATYGRFATGDDGLCIPFSEGHSYTGEQSAELSVHGSRASVSALVEACIANGARQARQGEFTERAFLNGRIDLTQAEGVRDTVDALTATQLRQSNLLRDGALRDEIIAIRSEVSSALAAIEASVDFSEEIGDLDKVGTIVKLRNSVRQIDAMLQTAGAGRILRQGYRIAIVGPPNAGKSSLLNALLGYDRAIVTDVPGTTRDFVEERLDLGGLPCVITDTAGLRDSGDRVESIGVERAKKVAETADEVWYVIDATTETATIKPSLLNALGSKVRLLRNKCDLLPAAPHSNGAHPISALKKTGLSELIDQVVQAIAVEGSERVWINERHQPLLNAAKQSIECAAQTLESDVPTDLASVHLQSALASLGEITGESASADVLESIFSTFCIGK